MTRILIAEDDPLIASFLERGLRAQGWTTTHVAGGEQAEHFGLSSDFDLLILDIGLAGRSGLDVLRHLRSKGSRLPVLVLTGRYLAHDVVTCLDAGADDYLIKPFRFEELLARARARLRGPGREASYLLAAGQITLDLRSRRATVRDSTVELTSREFTLLEILVRHPDHVLSREQLLSQAWGYSFDPSTNIVNVYISALRKKLGEGVIETVRGFGYRLRVADPG
ncbi:response regulator transcription factor [Asanoa siamensis]|uniref:DNA-binding response regulator n=1 Tax=Asanoa siamensis TaxID=926357 RepID=A0ABQ4CUL5_9ACTN|nr:response regulator transcription factor [Asanoa siamensis]GIF74971.1 DNA-binding response regulator [Asanoa siamensis]